MKKKNKLGKNKTLSAALSHLCRLVRPYLIINNYLPMAGLVLAFKKVNYNVGLIQSPWTGLSNFKYLFTTKDALYSSEYNSL